MDKETEWSRIPSGKNGGRISRKVWVAAQAVLGQPPNRMVVVKAHKGKSTEWLIEGNTKTIKLEGSGKKVSEKLWEMV